MIKNVLSLCIFLFLESFLPEAFAAPADLLNQTKNGIVHLRTKQISKRELFKLYDHYLNGRIPPADSTIALGSGLMLSSDGYVVTTESLISDLTQIEVIFPQNKNVYTAAVVGTDPRTDIALLKISGNKKNFPRLDLGDSHSLRVGDPIWVLANPFGYGPLLAIGYLAAKERSVGAGWNDQFMQFTGELHPGHAGGAVLDMRGRVIGMATLPNGGQGHVFIPINTVKAVIADLKAHGKVVRPWLGVIGRDILSSQDVSTSRQNDTALSGVIVQNLVADSPAAKAGLQVGDLITAIGKETVASLDQLILLLTRLKPNGKSTIVLFREGKGILTLPVSLEEMPKSQDIPLVDGIF